MKLKALALLLIMSLCLTVPVYAYPEDANVARTLKFTIVENSILQFKHTDFDSVCRVSSYLFFYEMPENNQGKLYYDYVSSDELGKQVGKKDQIIRDPVKKKPVPEDEDEDTSYQKPPMYMDNVSFVPEAGYTGTVEIFYRGGNKAGEYYYGEIQIRVISKEEMDKKATVSYEVDSTSILNIDEQDFADTCMSTMKKKLQYIAFDFDEIAGGALYTKYEDGASGNRVVKKAKKLLYNAEDSVTDSLKKVCFVPEQKFGGDIKIPYIGYTTDEEMYNGTLVISVNRVKVQGLSNFASQSIYKRYMFSDIAENEWYGAKKEAVVQEMYDRGLMKGNEDGTFNPKGNVTLAELITLGSRIYDLYYDLGTDFTGDEGEDWYLPYVEYAINNGIIKEAYEDYSALATREKTAYVLSCTIPQELTKPLTKIDICDVSPDNEYYESISLLYNSGIVSGRDEKGSFCPKENITRAELAAIAVRLVMKEKRLTAQIGE